MGKKNKNKRRGPAPTSTAAPLPQKRQQKEPHKHGQATRETIESLVIAFVLAFLFRTFQAEAFVIPTGSMAPTLMGRHADLECPECGQRFRVNESELTDADVENYRNHNPGVSPAQLMAAHRGVAGQCPDCRHTTWLGQVQGLKETDNVKRQRSYSGDRILVNKYLYSFTDPKRWDVVVFKYPGNAVENYIKRLVGLPGEELQIQGGDLFARPTGGGRFAILQKPADKILAMRQLVHDSRREPARLRSAGYPLRWNPVGRDSAWSTNEAVDDDRVSLSYTCQPADGLSWIRYHHIPPSVETWSVADRSGVNLADDAQQQLITDFNAYNTTIEAGQLRGGLGQDKNQGLHWVGDLIVETQVDIESNDGQLALELVEAGCSFRCTFDVGAGTATLTALPFGSDEPQTIASSDRSRVRGAGRHSLRMANVDDRLIVWVDDALLKFDSDTTYNAQELLTDDGAILPQSDANNPGDLAPAGVGAIDLGATVERLTLWRDIYYIAERSTRDERMSNPAPSDFHLTKVGPSQLVYRTELGQLSWEQLMQNPENWEAFRQRRTQRFQLAKDQFFVMGDNSAASSDARLWANGNGYKGGVPGGPYLERKMLIGKAVCVYWPHSFDKVPGTSIPFPLFPNVGDMRLVR